MRKRRGDLSGGHRLGVEIALDVVTFEFVEGSQLVVFFDAFGDRNQAQGVAQLDDAANHGGPRSVLIDPVDEGLVDLEDVNWEIPKFAERGMAGSEVVHGQAQAQILEGAETSERGVE